EANALFGGLARDRVLGLERVGERGERLAVEPLGALLVLERGEEAADLRRRQLGEVALGRRERPRPRVIDLDQAPDLCVRDDRDEQDGLHLHLAEHEQLGGGGAGGAGPDRARDARRGPGRGGGGGGGGGAWGAGGQ